MHKYDAHAATDVTGFGILGHAQNLARVQKSDVSFVIHNLPIINHVAAIAKACGMQSIFQGISPETSGKSSYFFSWLYRGTLILHLQVASSSPCLANKPLPFVKKSRKWTDFQLGSSESWRKAIELRVLPNRPESSTFRRKTVPISCGRLAPMPSREY